MSLHLIPRYVPPPSELLPMVGATPRQLARALDLTDRTIARWLAADEMPRAAALALYWLTPVGWSNVVSEGAHRLKIAEGLADALGRQNGALVARVALLERTGHFGSANAPTLQACAGWQALGR